ncbi:MAG: response regulator [Cyanobacteria bacterium]|nr:response regulator [Cyanobacteriota bacterium]
MSSATPNSHNTTPDSTYNSISYLSTRQVLSPTVGFYLRKLIRGNFDQLKLDRSGRSLLADGWGDLDRLLTMHHNHNDAAIQTAIQQLEHLTRAHQVLSSQGATFPEELRETERSIFALLGYQLQRQTDRGNILVVDDTPANVRILTDTLMHHGYEICSAMSGERALEIVKNFVPDLILLDVMMPEMDGYTLCQQLKERAETHDIPVMFLSAIDTQNDKIKAFQVGGVDYITKPFHLEEVIARVGQQIDRRNLQKRLEQQNFRLHAEIQNYKQLEERYRSIFDNAIDGMFQSTPEGQFITANASLARMYGYVSVEELCTSISDISQQLYVRPDRRTDFMRTVLRNGEVSDFEAQIYCKNGTILWISETVRSVKDAQNNLMFYEGTVKDITDRKRNSEILRVRSSELEETLTQLRHSQAKLLQQEKMSSLGQLVAGMAHEINNPVSFISGNLVYAEQYFEDLVQAFHDAGLVPGDDLEFVLKDLPILLQSIRTGADRIRLIVQALKNFSRIDEAEEKEVDIHEGIESTLLLLSHRLDTTANRPKVKVIKDLGSLPKVHCYPGLLNQALMNLMGNAIDALDASRTNGKQPKLELRTKLVDANQIMIWISDNGSGMPTEVQDRIFDPFFTTKGVGEGTGMGLAISYQIIVEKHGGQLECISVLGKGTEFVIILPVSLEKSFEKGSLNSFKDL